MGAHAVMPRPMMSKAFFIVGARSLVTRDVCFIVKRGKNRQPPPNRFALILRGPLNEENLWLRVVRRSHHSHWKRRSRKSAWLRMRGTHVILSALRSPTRWIAVGEIARNSSGAGEIEAF